LNTEDTGKTEDVDEERVRISDPQTPWFPAFVFSVLKIRLRFAAVAAVLLPLIAGCKRPAPVKQPMSLSHKRHMEADMKCLTCHPGAEDQALAQFPTVADCMDCHGKVRGNSPDEPKVRDYARRGQEIPWVRVDKLPGHVYFSHAAHVTLAKMKCEDCHQGILEAAQALTLPDVHQTMEDCMRCHKERNASNQCKTCHK
jgi:menaquinone reductase, multiheme cytochrome c subunit